MEVQDENYQEASRILHAPNYFELLGLPVPTHMSNTIEAKLVKKSYKKCALLVHPDKSTHPQANEAFKLLSKAFECLFNSTSQSEYILTLKPENVRNERKRARKRRTPFSEEEYVNHLTKKREKYEQRQKSKSERKSKEDEDAREEFKQQFFDEELNRNFNAWQSWKKGSKPKKEKPGERRKDNADHETPEQKETPLKQGDKSGEFHGQHQDGTGSFVCWVCLRRFATQEELTQHEERSQLHKDNMAFRLLNTDI